MKIYLTRHGQSQWNVEGRLQGSHDSDLTRKGIEDSQRLNKHLNDRGVELDIIYSSLSSRAITSAKIIRGNKSTQLVLKEELKEMDIGNWQGKTWDQIKRIDPKEYYRYWYAPHLYKANNTGENYYQLQKRVLSFTNKIIQKRKHENILIVSHGVVLNSILGYYQEKPIEQHWDQPLPEGTTLSLIDLTNNQIKIPFIGDASHLK